MIRRSFASGSTRAVVACLFACAVDCATSQGTIGAMLGQQADGRVFIREVPAGLGADRAGLRTGDELLLIDGIDVRSMSVAKLHAVLSGQVGEKVRVTAERGDRLLRVEVERTPARQPGRP